MEEAEAWTINVWYSETAHTMRRPDVHRLRVDTTGYNLQTSRWHVGDLERRIVEKEGSLMTKQSAAGPPGPKREPPKRPEPVWAYALGRTAAWLALDGVPDKQGDVEEHLAGLLAERGVSPITNSGSACTQASCSRGRAKG